MKSLISPYPGGKSCSNRYFGVYGKSLICDKAHHYDVLVDCFLGGGGVAFGHDHGCSHVIASDVDPGVLAVAECWGKVGDQSAVESLIRYWKERVLGNPKDAFAYLKDIHDKRFFCMSPPAIAAAYLTIKRLTFGGVLRCNKEGELNVALSADKLNSFLNAGRKSSRRRKRCTETPLLTPEMDGNADQYWGWQYEWPDNGVERLDVHHGWESAVQALADSDYQNALVVVDAPYWTPDQKMTEAYAHHGDPGSDEVMRLTTDCLDAVLATGKASRIVVFNYLTPELKDAIDSTLGEYYEDFLPDFSSNLGPLNTMNQGNGENHDYYSEAVWEIGGKRMFADFDAAVQRNLLEVIA